MPFLHLPALPDSIQPYLELRERFERRLDRDFDASKPDDRSDLLSRIRVGLNTRVSPNWRATLEYQYAHDLAWTPARNFSTENSDASLAYLQGKLKWGTLIVGRQKILLGQQRLVGSFEWNNVARSFDGVRATSGDWEAFAATIGVASPRPRDARLAAISHRSQRWGETSIIAKHDATPSGDVDIQTLDELWTGRDGKLTIDAEGALQFGRDAGKNQRAWALHARAGYALGVRTKAYVEGDAASGGSDKDANFTFDNLYPTNHAKYGLLDMVGWRNMNEIAVGVEHAPCPDLALKLGWASFSLRDAADAWYSAAGTPVMADPTGASGKDLGSEIDLDAAWSPRHRPWSLQAGLGLFSPGDYVRNLKGVADKQVFGYLQLGTKF